MLRHVLPFFFEGIGLRMNTLKLTLFWVTLYIAAIFVLGLSDNVDRPIVNFASYFYLTVLIAFPLTIFFPSISKISPYVPMLVWAGIYMLILQVVDRTNSTETIEFSVIVLEVLLLELGIWLAHRLAIQISQAESFLEALALGAFPSRVRGIDQEQDQIKKEFARSRRYDRPLSLVVIESERVEESPSRELLKNIHDDLTHRFRSAKVGQIVDENTRQTDILMKDHKGRFVILCPETNQKSVAVLAERFARDVQEKTGLQIVWGKASFPEDALSFDDLLNKARERLVKQESVSAEQLTAIQIS
jgi:GGDEF domain-containing protein